MKQLIFAILLSISMIVFTAMSGVWMTRECDRLCALAGDSEAVHAFRERWERFSMLSAFLTPYDVIRSGDSTCRQYVALVESNADPADIEAAREVLISSLLQIKRIHSVDWELIF